MSRTHLTSLLALAGLLSAHVPATRARADTEAPVLVQALWAGRKRGNSNCQPGDRSCNVCAVTVAQQFADVFHGHDAQWKTKPYSFSWDKQYAPSALTPNAVFDDGNTLPREHIQGFVRTNSSVFPYAGSHADDTQGAYFFVQQDDAGVKSLAAIHGATGKHPSGVHTLGAYLIGAEGDSLRLFDVDRALEAQDTRYPVTVGKSLSSAGGGIGMAQLGSGEHLLVSSPDGDLHPTSTRFHRLRGDLGAPSIEYLGEDSPAAWDAFLEAKLGRSLDASDWEVASENLSVITECDTGDIYVIHTTGDESVLGNVFDTTDGIWRLSKVTWKDSDSPSLTPVDYAIVSQNREDCHLRSSATVHPDSQNRLIFYCHERSAREPLTEDESLHFTVGTPYENQD